MEDYDITLSWQIVLNEFFNTEGAVNDTGPIETVIRVKVLSVINVSIFTDGYMVDTMPNTTAHCRQFYQAEMMKIDFSRKLQCQCTTNNALVYGAR